MTTASTVYDVRIRYLLDDKASKALSNINAKANRAANSTGLLNRAFRGLAVVAAGGFGIKKALDFTIGFNRELAQTRTKLTTVVQALTGVNRGTALGQASTLMTQLREDAKKSAGTFQEMTDFSSSIAPAVLKAGASMQTLREITRGGVVAAAAFGEKAEFAALDIKQALTKGVSSKDRFSSLLLASVNVTTKAFNKLNEAGKLKTLQKAFNQPAIKEAANEFQNSFEGTFSTLKSTLQEFGGKVGAKLFARLSVELQRVNKWFDANEKRVDEFAKTLADGLVKGFKIIKSVFSFIITHKNLLLTIAKAILISKGIGGLAGTLANFPKFNAGVSGFIGKLGVAGQALGTFAVLAQGFADAVLENQKKSIDRKTNNGALNEAAIGLGGGRVSAGARAGNKDFARRLGLKSDSGSGAFGAITGRLTAEQKGASKRILSFLNGPGGKVIADRSKRVVDLKELQKTISIAPSRQDVFRVADIVAKERFGTGFSALSAGQQGGLLAELNTGSRKGKDIERFSQLLIGLDIALRQETRMQTDAFLKKLADPADRADMARMMAEKIGDTMKLAFNPLLQFLGLSKGEKASEAKVKDKKNNTKVGKVVINVTSDDPDRMAFGLEGLFSDLAKNGAQAANAPRGF